MKIVTGVGACHRCPRFTTLKRRETTPGQCACFQDCPRCPVRVFLSLSTEIAFPVGCRADPMPQATLAGQRRQGMPAELSRRLAGCGRTVGLSVRDPVSLSGRWQPGRGWFMAAIWAPRGIQEKSGLDLVCSRANDSYNVVHSERSQKDGTFVSLL